MNPLVPFMLAFVVLLLMWGVYETFRVAIVGRWRAATIVALTGVSLFFVVFLATLWEFPDAAACSDQAELLIEAIPGPGAKIGSVQGWDFFNCTLYWYR
jgi:predicted PurR-regulated permease PerM